MEMSLNIFRRLSSEVQVLGGAGSVWNSFCQLLWHLRGVFGVFKGESAILWPGSST